MSGDRGDRRPLAAYATLVRLPNLFTAPPDVVLGAALVAGAGYTVSTGATGGLAVASVLLYAAGTTLNDYFDADEDSRVRPERPIPSGEVSRRGALTFGIALLVSGVAIALITVGPDAGAVACGLALVILLYDGVFKDSFIGFLFMGGARGLNVLLGTTVATPPTRLPFWTLAVPAIILLYIVGVTYMAESETGNGDSGVVSTAAGGVAIATIGVIGLLFLQSPPLIETVVAGALLAGFVGWTGRALRAAYVDPTPETIGPAVGACVLGLIVLDAAFTATIDVVWSLVALSFLVPAVGLARVFDVT